MLRFGFDRWQADCCKGAISENDFQFRGEIKCC